MSDETKPVDQPTPAPTADAEPDEFFSLFTTDPDLEKRGVWVEYGNRQFLISRAGGHNRQFNRVSEAVMRPFRRQIQLETISHEKADELMAIVYARAVVKNWRVKKRDGSYGAFTDRNGVELPFNEKNFIAFVLEFPDLFGTLKEDASKPNIYRAEQLEGDLKN